MTLDARLPVMDCRFLVRDPAFARPARNQVNDDARRARLTLAYRGYCCVRPLLPMAVRRLLWRTLTAELDDRWYADTRFDDVLARAFERRGGSLRMIHPWPDGKQFGLVLTHDVESLAGLRNVERIAALEETLGFRSSWNVVPYDYTLDEGLLRDLRARGFEIGIHGFNHDGKLYWSESTFRRRAERINEALEYHGAVGFRSPMVHRNLEWLQLLNIEYDASCFDIDPVQSMPGGVGSIWPFIAGRLVELQYTMPQDHTLFVALGRRDCDAWRHKLDFIVRRHGMALMLTHPDYLIADRNRELYREFLTGLRDRDDYWHALPRDVAAWWRDRDCSTLERDRAGDWRVRGPAARAGALATIGVADGELAIRRVEAQRPETAEAPGAPAESRPSTPSHPHPETAVLLRQT